ncbi:trypsin-like peptidase domain-containing protein [Luteolibacter pohnpeiensis]|uniref:Trypsin-like peptidase domain-containing protein n=1 Tax=Luteolibacter pohnpeiensis TaxID=454153 RepID=A0A934SBY0_9BACT|nr:trypsin-like peptidase domain-containing protein [Luteolibacter pohnpeiensis]MBK1883347.1 trypsin-like peptidase domain-containing protein [Luteolibacter pohnpeiensis]
MKNLAFLGGVMAVLVSFAQANECAETMMNATFKLFNKDSTATCFLIQDQSQVFIVSAGHTFEKSSGRTSILVLRELDGDKDYERKDVKVQIRSDGKPLWTKNPDYDVAVMPVKLDLPENATLPISSLIEKDLPGFGDDTILLTYPARVEANEAGFPLARRALVASYPAKSLEKQPTFMLDVTSWDGDSGGPVFIDNGQGKPAIYGLVIERINHIENITGERETRRIETAMGLSRAVHASVILQTIRLAQSKGAHKES